jgi:cytidine deaminase
MNVENFGKCKSCCQYLPGKEAIDAFYCSSCWEIYDINQYRCFSFAMVYDMHEGTNLSFGSSIYSEGCAERSALWKLDPDDAREKLMIVARIRRNANDRKMSFGNSKPCSQCILAMQMYNVKEVLYSHNKQGFVHEQVNGMNNSYTSKGMTIVRL